MHLRNLLDFSITDDSMENIKNTACKIIFAENLANMQATYMASGVVKLFQIHCWISLRLIEMKSQLVDIKSREVNDGLLPTVKYGK